MAIRNSYRISVYDDSGFWSAFTVTSLELLRAHIASLTAQGYDLVVRLYGSHSVHVRTFEHVANI